MSRTSNDVVDLTCRQTFADALEGYLTGQLNNFSLDDAVSACDSRDRLCIEIAGQAYFLYCDFREHFNTGKDRFPQKIEEMVSRWIVLLRTERSFRQLHERKLLCRFNEESPSRFVRFFQRLFSRNRCQLANKPVLALFHV